MTILLLRSNRKSDIGYRFAYLYLSLTHSKGHGQEHANLYCDYSGNYDRANTTIIINKKSYVDYRLAYLHWSTLKVKVQDHSRFDCENFEK